MANWYCMMGGKKYGPLDTSQLQQLAADGRFKPEDMVMRDGLDGWVKAFQVKGLFDQKPADSADPGATITFKGSVRKRDTFTRLFGSRTEAVIVLGGLAVVVVLVAGFLWMTRTRGGDHVIKFTLDDDESFVDSPSKEPAKEPAKELAKEPVRESDKAPVREPVKKKNPPNPDAKVVLTQETLQGEWRSKETAGRIYMVMIDGSNVLTGILEGSVLRGRHDVYYSIKPGARTISFGSDGEGRLITQTTMQVNLDFNKSGKKTSILLQLAK